jgi:hypothetical protein
VDTYNALAESSFRNYTWLIDDARRIVEGRAIAQSARAPLLGDLEQRLDSRPDDLSKAPRAGRRSAHTQLRSP